MERIEFHGWHILANPDRTRELYESVFTSAAERCRCLECRNFVRSRQHAYPDELLTLLEHLAVNRFHEAEVDHYGERSQGRARYLVEFYFSGTLLDDDEKLLEPVSPWERGSFIRIDPDTEIRFSPVGLSSALQEPWVLIECYVWVPWISETDRDDRG